MKIIHNIFQDKFKYLKRQVLIHDKLENIKSLSIYLNLFDNKIKNNFILKIYLKIF
jgi:hypothetical protein